MMIMMMATGSHENDNLCLSSVRFLVKHCTMHTSMYICTILVPMHYRYMNLLARVFAIESYDECVQKHNSEGVAQMRCSFVWVNAGMKIVMRGRHITHTMTSKYTYDKSNINIASLFMDWRPEPSLTLTWSLLVCYQRSSAMSVSSIYYCWKCLSCGRERSYSASPELYLLSTIWCLLSTEP